MKRIQDGELLVAVEQACKEESFAYAAVAVGGSDKDAVLFGGLTPRIALILGRNLGSVRRRLNAMQKKGVVLRHGKGNSTYRWWPVGLHARCIGPAGCEEVAS